MVRVGLIGFGMAAKAFHAPVICGVAGMELAAVLQRSGDEAKQKYPQVHVAHTLDELLSDKTIDLCVIATSNDSHYGLAKACLEAGRHVVVDKPLTPTLAEAEDLVRLAHERGRLLTVYQDRRYDGISHTVRKLVASGVLGDIAEYESRYDRFRPEPKANAWRERADFPAAGVLWDLGPHLIDMALVLFGEPTAVSATAIRQRKTSLIDDAFDVCLQYPWTRVSLKARILAYAPGPNLLIHGTGGSFIKYGMDPQEAALRGPNCPVGLDWGQKWGVEPEENWGTLSLASGETRRVPTERGDYRGFYANVRDVIEKGAALDVTPKQFLATTRTIVLAHKSSRERRVVDWNEPAE